MSLYEIAILPGWDDPSVTILGDGASLEVVSPANPASVSVSATTPTSIELSLAPIGPTGPQGPQGPAGAPGPNEIGGFSIVVSSPQAGDVLAFGANAWINSSQSNITDGGNF